MTVEHLYSTIRKTFGEEIQAPILMGRLTALRKADGGVRGVMARDVVHRLVARAMSQQLMDAVQHTTLPFQNAIPVQRFLSVDGVSANDTMSQKAMEVVLHCCWSACFCGTPSKYLLGGRFWHGSHHRQGDALMPFVVFPWRTWRRAEELHEEETLLAFLDDTHVVPCPDRTRTVCAALQEATTQGRRRSGTQQG